MDIDKAIDPLPFANETLDDLVRAIDDTNQVKLTSPAISEKDLQAALGITLGYGHQVSVQPPTKIAGGWEMNGRVINLVAIASNQAGALDQPNGTVARFTIHFDENLKNRRIVRLND